MKKLIFAVLMMFSTLSFSAAIDKLDAGSDMEYCEVATQQFGAGYGAQRAGFARIIGPLTPMDIEKLEHRLPLNKQEGMKFYNWDQTDPQDRAFVIMNVLEGYDFAALYPSEDTEEAANLAMQGKFQQCMKFRTHLRSSETEKKRLERDALQKQRFYKRLFRNNDFIKTASSQALVDPRVTDELFCNRMVEVIEGVLILKIQGITQEQLYAEYPMPSNWSEDFKTYIAGVVNEIYNFEGEAAAYLDSFIKTCKK